MFHVTNKKNNTYIFFLISDQFIDLLTHAIKKKNKKLKIVFKNKIRSSILSVTIFLNNVFVKICNL